METVAARVLTEIKSVYPYTITNRDVARGLSIPEPSVRRATHQLMLKGLLIEWSGGYSNIPVAYKAAAV